VVAFGAAFTLKLWWWKFDISENAIWSLQFTLLHNFEWAIVRRKTQMLVWQIVAMLQIIAGLAMQPLLTQAFNTLSDSFMFLFDPFCGCTQIRNTKFLFSKLHIASYSQALRDLIMSAFVSTLTAF
jgi:hypothetical protein